MFEKYLSKLWILAVLNFCTPFLIFAQNNNSSYLKEIGVQIFQPDRHYRGTKTRQNFVQMKIDLGHQQRKNLLAKTLTVEPTRHGLASNPTIFSEDFEGNFPGNFWQVLSSRTTSGWGVSSKRVVSGSHSLWCAGSARSVEMLPKYSYDNNLITWLITGPYDFSQFKSASLDFYYWLKSELNKDYLFWGVSIDGQNFYGTGSSGFSGGWQFVHFNLKEIPQFGNALGKKKVWIAFTFFSNDSLAEFGAFLDQIQLHYDQAWHQQLGAFLDGAINLNAFSGGVGLARPAFADIDQDGDLDLFVGTYDGTLHFYRNEGTPGKPRWHLIDARYGEIDVGENSAPVFIDLDGDGDLDLLLGEAEGTLIFYENTGNPERAIWKHRGKLKDETGKIIDVGTTSVPALVDIDADGDLDLFVGNTEGFIAYYQNRSQSLQLKFHLVSPRYLNIDVGYLSSPTFADMDADGDFDFFTGIRENRIYFYQNIGSPHQPEFKLKSTFFDSIQVGSITAPALADLDSDGDLDLCIGQADGRLNFYVNAGNKNQWQFVASPQRFDLQTLDFGFQSAPALVDLDGDKDLDLVVGAADGKFYYMQNVGDPHEPQWKLMPDFFQIRVKNNSTPVFVDIDGDGDLDLFSGSKLGKISFFRNDGNKYQPKWTLVNKDYESIQIGGQTYPAFADIDADGDNDLFIGTDVHGIAYFENVGSSQQPIWQLRTSNFLNLKFIFRLAPIFVDLDQDGDLDLLAGTHEGTLAFVKNIGTVRKPGFQFISAFYNNINVRFYSVPAFGDLDADGDLDLILGNNSGGLYLWKNLSHDESFNTQQDDLIKRSAQNTGIRYKLPNQIKIKQPIPYRLLQPLYLLIQIFDLQGQQIRTLTEGFQEPGDHEIMWDGKDDQGHPREDGIYFLKIRAENFVHTHKIFFAH